jgi:Cu(I)/Ag(I) efflux system membrane protein CusA/SilA
MNNTSKALPQSRDMGWIDRILWFSLNNKLVIALAIVFFAVWGIMTAPFDWDTGALPRSPVPVDAIPDLGENQQIVFTDWPGRSPQDVENQITYPLTAALLGVPEVKTIRSMSAFGFSTIYVIFEENADFYWSRSRLLEKLNSLPPDTLPDGVQPALGPDATALGQVFWYTLEGRDPQGNPAGGWDLAELRSIQDWLVRYALQSAHGVSEVASAGGFVQEYQIDVDPDAMRAADVTLNDVFEAVRTSNVDVGARTIEVNKVEYVIRGLGFIKTLDDIETAAIKVEDNTPVRVRDVARVSLGPALRAGALDKGGAEAVGGVVVVRYGANPLEMIKNVKAKIAEIAPGLPTKAVIDWSKVSQSAVEAFAAEQGFEAYHGADLNQSAWLAWLRAHDPDDWPEWALLSQVTIVPFYDRTGLIYETLGTLNTAIVLEILVTIIVVIVMVRHLRSSLLISMLLPLAVLMCFIAMRLFRVDANIVALSGIAIAVGTMVDMGVIVCENILNKLDEAGPDGNRLVAVFEASSEVGGAVLTAVATTVVSFLPVFTMTAAEGKLFRPLAFTKTFALLSSVIIAVVLIPPMAHVLMGGRPLSLRARRALGGAGGGGGHRRAHIRVLVGRRRAHRPGRICVRERRAVPTGGRRRLGCRQRVCGAARGAAAYGRLEPAGTRTGLRAKRRVCCGDYRRIAGAILRVPAVLCPAPSLVSRPQSRVSGCGAGRAAGRRNGLARV